MSDHLFRDGDVLHLAAPERDEVIALGAMSHNPVRTDIITRGAPSETRCDLETRGMDELAPDRVSMSVGPPRPLRDDPTGVTIHEPAGVVLCDRCAWDSRAKYETQARLEALSRWRPGA